MREGFGRLVKQDRLAAWDRGPDGKGRTPWQTPVSLRPIIAQVHIEVRRAIEAGISRVVMFVFGVIGVLIAIRFVFTLLGANAEAGFVKFVHNLPGVSMALFNTVLKALSVSGVTFERSALVAIAVYALIAWGLVALVRSASPLRHSETVERVE